MSSGIGGASVDVCPPHPHPCGNEWPAGLEGPFELAEVRYVKVPSFDGTLLEGWIGVPDVPEGVRVPVALHSTPYNGYCHVVPHFAVSFGSACFPSPNDPAWWSETGSASSVGVWDGMPLSTWGVPPIELVRRGYAAAFFSVRGTGNSGGCFEFLGPKEQRDQAWIVDWLGAQSWSNGRVGMGGVSYPGTTPWEAAIEAPAALKTIVTSGIISDLYTFWHTPQGAAYSYGTMLFEPTYVLSPTLVPPLGGGAGYGTIDHASVLPERVCNEVVEAATEGPVGGLTDVRHEDHYAPRRLISRFDLVTAAVLLAQGFDDTAGSAHAFQESAAWHALSNAPKRQVEGQWGHTFPMAEVATFDATWEHDTWSELLFGWLDYWLKGIGPNPEGLGRVDYQDSAGTWRPSSAWPPVEAADEAVYLAGGELSGTPGDTARSFRSGPVTTNDFGGAEFFGVPTSTWPALCAEEPVATASGGLVYLSEPMTETAVIAGNPFAYLRMESDLPGGIVAVAVLEIPADFDCAAVGEPPAVHLAAFGAADLRFHDGNMIGSEFPVGEPVEVRVDLWDLAESIEIGNRLAVVVSSGEATPVHSRIGQPYYPRIIVHGNSHVVLPIVEGTFGGSSPTLDYPQRPFVPLG